MNLKLRPRLERFFRNHPDTWFPSGEIQRMVTERTHYTPSNATRRLREMAEEGILEVKQVKNHAHYKLASQAVVERSGGYLQGPELEAVISKMGTYYDLA